MISVASYRAAMIALAPISLACWTIRSKASARVFSHRLVRIVMLPPNSGLQAGADIADHRPRANDQAAHHAQVADDAIAGQLQGRGAPSDWSTAGLRMRGGGPTAGLGVHVSFLSCMGVETARARAAVYIEIAYFALADRPRLQTKLVQLPDELSGAGGSRLAASRTPNERGARRVSGVGGTRRRSICAFWTAVALGVLTGVLLGERRRPVADSQQAGAAHAGGAGAAADSAGHRPGPDAGPTGRAARPCDWLILLVLNTLVAIGIGLLVANVDSAGPLDRSRAARRGRKSRRGSRSAHRSSWTTCPRACSVRSPTTATC